MSGPNTPSPSATSPGHRAGPGAWGCPGREHPGHRLRFRHPDQPGRRRLCLRRVDRPLRLHRGPGGRARHPAALPVERGLWGRPTVLNNVETWANVPLIIEKGAKWYASIGVPHSTGTKIFSLVGKVKNIGLVEVPMGIPLGRHRRRDRRRRARAGAVQGGPNRGTFRRLYSL